MNINYHYYAIKTLAVHAGFDDEKAQIIAHFSQQIDNYIMGSPFIVNKEPPDFFLRERLAVPFAKNRWAFLPCTTGINMVRTFSGGYQRNTLMPFHFIMPVALPAVPQGATRCAYRCEPAYSDPNLMINRFMDAAVKAADADDKKSLMALGMLLHTFADTYSHCGFSAFQGWENAAYVHKMERGSPRRDEMGKAEKNLLRALPSIGHGNVGVSPDNSDCTISLYGKKTERSAFEPLVERDNTEFFAECSRRVLDILCEVMKRPKYEEAVWNALRAKLVRALSIKEQSDGKVLTQQWKDIFPNISYGYKKHEFVNVRFDIVKRDSALLERFNVREDDLADMYSDEGDRVRLSSLTIARDVSDWFYDYNEAAYRHVFKATREYASHTNFTNIDEYAQMAKAANV